MILLLGATGYVGSAFRRLFAQKRVEYLSVSRTKLDYTRLSQLRKLILESQPELLINCAGYTGKPNVDACEHSRIPCLKANALLPKMIRRVCEETATPFGHISTGCIYSGTRPDGKGFTEIDPPNFCFETGRTSFYSGTKALAEKYLSGADQTYIWRLRIPFNNIDGPRNYLSKLLYYPRLLIATNSLTQLDEFVLACFESWNQRIPFGTYNVTNSGAIETRQVVALLKKHLGIEREFEYFDSEEQFMQNVAKAPRSNCVLDNSKLLSHGIQMSSVHDAIAKSLQSWQV